MSLTLRTLTLTFFSLMTDHPSEGMLDEDTKADLYSNEECWIND